MEAGKWYMMVSGSSALKNKCKKVSDKWKQRIDSGNLIKTTPF